MAARFSIRTARWHERGGYQYLRAEDAHAQRWTACSGLNFCDKLYMDGVAVALQGPLVVNQGDLLVFQELEYLAFAR